MPDTLTRFLDWTKRQLSFSHYIQLSSVIADNIVCGKGGELVASWKLRGLAFETADDIDVETATDAVNTLYRALAQTDKLAVQVHRIRRPMTDELTASDEPGFARDLSLAYNRRVGHEHLMATELYVTLISNDRRKLNSVNLQDEIDDFEKICGIFEKSFNAYEPERLGVYRKHDAEFSSQLSFYNFLLTGVWQEVRVPDAPLYDVLGNIYLHANRDTIEIQHPTAHSFCQSLELKDYAQSTYAGILDGLLFPDLGQVKPYRFVETQTFCFLSKREGQRALELQQKQLHASEDAGFSQIAAMTEAIDSIVNGDFALGDYSYTFFVFDDTAAAARRDADDAQKKLQDEGFLPFRSNLALMPAFFSQLPLGFRYSPRTAKITSMNFSELAPFHNLMSGKRDKNPWGECVALLKTPSDQPFYFNFHQSAVNEDAFDKKTLANTTVIGTSGSGKTVLMNFLLAMSQKYRNGGKKMTTIYFDKDRGAEIAIRAMRGGYLSVQNGQPTGFNPFQIEPTEDNIQFLISFVKLLLSMDKQPITTSETLALTEAVRGVMRMPKELRRIGIVPQMLPEGLTKEERENSLAKRLTRWVEGGDLAWVFDNPVDELDFDAYPNMGIDGTEFLDNTEVRTPIAYYLLHRMDEVIDGRRFIFIMDEFWKWLLDDAFRDFAFNKLKTIRKQNGFGIFATQSPSDVIESPIAKAVIEQSATQIFLPNPRADKDDYVKGFKTTETEFDIIRQIPVESRAFLVKQGSSSAVCRLDLGWAGKALKVLSGSTDNIEKVEQLRERFGDNPDAWLPEFLEKKA